VYTTYALLRASAFEPVAVWNFSFYLCFVFALVERKNEKGNKVPL
jgi:hypothetical protein